MVGVAIGINASGGAPAYSAAQWRQAAALALMYDGRNMGGRKGVRPGDNQLSVSYAAPTITVQPGLCYLDPALSTPQGGYWVAIPVAETFTLTAADATNPRKDIVVARVYDHDEDASGLRLARTEYLVGTPNPSPSEPAVPAGAIKLALLDVPASPGAVVVTDRRPWTVAPGGILPVAAAADITAGTEGRYRDRLDNNLLERDSGSVWETIADPQVFKAWTAYTPAWTATTTNPVLGNGSIIGTFRQVGKTVDIRVILTMGSTTTFGTGVYRISLPVGAKIGSIIPAIAIDASAGSAAWVGAARIFDTPATGDIMRIIFADGSAGAGPTNPITWAVGDQLLLDGSYEAA